MMGLNDEWIYDMIMIIANDLMKNIYSSRVSSYPLGQRFPFSREVS
jgi:hypothetical protein